MPHRRAFTLIEVLVVITIIAMLVGLVLTGIGYISSKAAQQNTIALLDRTHAALEYHQVKRGRYPIQDSLPDEDQITEDNQDETVGGFLVDLSNTDDPTTGTQLVDTFGLSISFQDDLDDNGHLIDAWGNPIRYIRGNYENRLSRRAVLPLTDEACQPQDLNRPDLVAEQRLDRWNTANRGGYPYIWSIGPNNGLESPEEWVLSNVEGN
jgi:prepilin-type N-terminal cleavage/methylation domain-containing protein